MDDSIRAKIEELTGEELIDEDYDSAVDGVIIWWRDGDPTRTNWPAPLSTPMRFSAMTARCGCSPEAGTSGCRKLQHRAVRGQDRRHERRHSADRQAPIGTRTFTCARSARASKPRLFAIFSRIRKSPRAHWVWGISLLQWTFRQNTSKTWAECGQNTGARVDITRDDMRFLDFSRRCEKWAMRDSNPRHPPCKGGALTN